MSIGQWIWCWIDWAGFSIFGSLVDVMDMYITMLGNISIYLIKYLVEINPTFTNFIINLKDIAKVIFSITLLGAVFFSFAGLKFDNAPKYLQNIFFVAVAVSAVPFIFSWSVNTVQQSIVPASMLGSKDTVLGDRRGLANSMTHPSDEIYNFLESGGQCNGYSSDWVGWFGEKNEKDKWYGTEDDRTDGSQALVGVQMPLWFGESKQDIVNRWKNMGLDPNDNNDIFPNLGGSSGIVAVNGQAPSGGMIKWNSAEPEGAASQEVMARFFNVACPVGGQVADTGDTSNRENKGVIRYYAVLPLWLQLVYAFVLFAVCLVITFKMVDTVFEMLIMGALLHLTAAISVSEIGKETFKNNLKQFFTQCVGIILLLGFTSLMMNLMGELISTDTQTGGVGWIMSQLKGPGGVLEGKGSVFQGFVQIMISIVFIAGAGFFTINGSDAVKSLVGYDTGMGSSYLAQATTARALGMAGKAVGRGASKVANTGKNIAKGAGNEIKDTAKSGMAQHRLNKNSKVDENGKSNYDKRKAEFDNLSAEEKKQWRDMAQSHYQQHGDIKGREDFVDKNDLNTEKLDELAKEMYSGETIDRQMAMKNQNTLKGAKEGFKEVGNFVGSNRALRHVATGLSGNNVQFSEESRRNMKAANAHRRAQRRTMRNQNFGF